MKKLVVLKNRFKAELLMANLSQNGIHAVELDKKETVTQSIGSIEIHVEEEKYAEAVKILNDIGEETI